MCSGKNTIFPDNTGNIISQHAFWKDNLFRTFEKNIIFPCIYLFIYFFWERSSFIFHLRGKIIFSGKRNIIFSNNTRKIIFQCNFFGKTIFSGRLEKKMVCRAVVSVPRVHRVIKSHRYFNINILNTPICITFILMHLWSNLPGFYVIRVWFWNRGVIIIW